MVIIDFNSQKGEYKTIDMDFFKEKMIRAIKQDRKVYKRGIKRYELKKNLNGDIMCADADRFDYHTSIYNSQGFFEHKRIKSRLGSIPCELVIMRHVDESKCFQQYDGLMVEYQKAGCELCYYEVVL